RSQFARLPSGLDAARARSEPAKLSEKKKSAGGTLAALEQETRRFPAPAQPITIEGVRRLVAYQSPAYARLYLDRLHASAKADETAGAQGRLLTEVARQLAVRMSYEDVVRVAQAKIAPERMRRIAQDELRVSD